MTGLAIPEMSLVVLIGASGSGKSTFAARHFRPTEILSSDFCRGLVADDENDQSASAAAFDVLHYIAGKRLAAGRLTVIDATNVQPRARGQLVALAREHDVLPVAIVLDLPDKVCIERNAARADRDFGAAVVRRQRDQLRRGLRSLSREGFRRVHVLKSVDEVAAATIDRQKLLTDYREFTGPFDVIGDVHGCLTELTELLQQLGYRIRLDEAGRPVGAQPPAGRRAIFLGDLVDRGPDTPGVLRLVMGMVAADEAFAVPGNHENKLVRALRGRNVSMNHGLPETLAALKKEPDEFRNSVLEFCDGLVSHLVLDGGRLVVAHAGLKEEYQGRASGRVRSFALYGDTTGETDEFGLPIRYPWANDYRGAATVLYGHTPIPEPEWLNNTLCLDTGCVFGGKLSALRYPEREIVSVPAHETWCEPARPLAPQRDPAELKITDVLGRRVIETAYHGRVSVREENAAGALEVMSRFALDPRLVPYLPPTMAPCATSKRPDVLEHPEDAFADYRGADIAEVICEEKHMGSRAVVLIGPEGAIYTRTGRPFFDAHRTGELVDRLRKAVDRTGLWERFQSDWLLFDAELLPWSAKAGDLLRNQYAAVGAAARAALPVAISVLEDAAAAGRDVADLLARTKTRNANAAAYSAAYGRYCWPIDGIAGIEIAPFQLLAAAGATYSDRDHNWHLAIADELCAADPELFRPTRRLVVDTHSASSIEKGVRWWEELTAAGGEGMVVKPLANLVRTAKGIVQPGIKCRGRDYLRIIYGPDYTERLDRLRQRNLGYKRSMALREYALGLEGLDRFVRGEPLWRVHECVFAVLAAESEPVDPRL